MSYRRKAEILNESTMCRRLDLSTDQLTELRRKHNFPFIRISATRRAYDWEDVLQWLSERKCFLGGSEANNEGGEEPTIA